MEKIIIIHIADHINKYIKNPWPTPTKTLFVVVMLLIQSQILMNKRMRERSKPWFTIPFAILLCSFYDSLI